MIIYTTDQVTIIVIRVIRVIIIIIMVPRGGPVIIYTTDQVTILAIRAIRVIRVIIIIIIIIIIIMVPRRSRTVIIYTTDQVKPRSSRPPTLFFPTLKHCVHLQSFHSAGDGKLGGLTLPNDGQCHLNYTGFYDWSTVQVFGFSLCTCIQQPLSH